MITAKEEMERVHNEYVNIFGEDSMERITHKNKIYRITVGESRRHFAELLRRAMSRIRNDEKLTRTEFQFLDGYYTAMVDGGLFKSEEAARLLAFVERLHDKYTKVN